MWSARSWTRAFPCLKWGLNRLSRSDGLFNLFTSAPAFVLHFQAHYIVRKVAWLLQQLDFARRRIHATFCYDLNVEHLSGAPSKVKTDKQSLVRKIVLSSEMSEWLQVWIKSSRFVELNHKRGTNHMTGLNKTLTAASLSVSHQPVKSSHLCRSLDLRRERTRQTGPL